MLDYHWDWSVIWQFRAALAEGFGVTLVLSSLAIVFGTFGGLALGVVLSVRSSVWAPIRIALQVLVDSLRALPPLILLLLLYYWLPYALDIRSSFWLAAISFSLHLSAFVADVFRHAIDGVPRPLLEAAYALGMSRSVVIRRLVMPEALRTIVPTLGLLFIDIMKISSLASIIAVGELVHRASEVSTYSFRFLEVYAALAAIYLAVLLPFSYFVRRLERSSLFLRRS